MIVLKVLAFKRLRCSLDPSSNMASSLNKIARLTLSKFSQLQCNGLNSSLQPSFSIRRVTQQRSKEKWDLVSAVFLERQPIIGQAISDVEQKYQKYWEELELEGSLLSNHELRHREDMKLAEKRKADDYEESELDAVRQTALEAEDEWEAEYHQFTPASTFTDADEENDHHSIKRALDKRLVLLVKQKIGVDNIWALPMKERQDGENMRQAAEKALKMRCGEDIEAKFLGNAPCGFYKYKYPTAVRSTKGLTGAKVFIFKAQLRKGQFQNNDDTVSDHAWVSRDNFDKYLLTEFNKTLQKSILDL